MESKEISGADALASTAHLLQMAGWMPDQGWGFEVTLPPDFDFGDADVDTMKPLADWKKLGVKRANGEALPAVDRTASIIIPAGAHGPAFVVFDNFRAILKYNNAQSYALAVALLADRIKGAGPLVAAWPRNEPVLTRDQRIALQNDLKKLGYDAGDSDGVLGHKVRASLRAYQKTHGLAADGFATEDLLLRMDHEVAVKGSETPAAAPHQ